MANYYPDISHWITVTDWTKIQQNCPFIISKATQGTDMVDPTLDSFIKNCEAKKIPYWLYTFLNKGNEKAQAEFLVKTCKNKVGSYFRGYILDVERNNTAAGVKSALDYLKTQCKKQILYTMYAQYSTYKSVIDNRGSSCSWWEARYGKDDGKYSSAYPCHSGVDLHQFTSKGTCPGIKEKCDLSRIASNRKVSWYTNATTTTTTTTTTTPKPVNTSTSTTTTTKPAKKSLDVIAKEVIANKWGTGDNRKKKLKSAGYTDAEIKSIQSKVNAILHDQQITKVAKDVIAGKYGNWPLRKKRVEKAGYNYEEVRKKVNELLKK